MKENDEEKEKKKVIKKFSFILSLDLVSAPLNLLLTFIFTRLLFFFHFFLSFIFSFFL